MVANVTSAMFSMQHQTKFAAIYAYFFQLRTLARSLIRENCCEG